MDNPLNLKTKYAINKLSCYFENTELFDDRGSIEHILPETEGITQNIGNLILLEDNLNVEAGNERYALKKPTYSKSTYKWIKQFVEDNNEWEEGSINSRAELLAKIYYEKIFGRSIE